MATDNTGTANSPYNAVSIETISGEIQAAPLNTSLGNLDTAVESHTHPLDSNVGWDAMKSSFRPVDTGDSSDRWRLVSGTKPVTLASGLGNATITFATDADQGDPSFSGPDSIVVTGNVTDYTGGGGQMTVMFSSPSNSTCEVYVDDPENHSGSENVAWTAYGKVA